MITVKDVFQEYSHSWSPKNKYYNDGFLVNKKDLDLLSGWLDTQLIKFDKYQGKIYFHPDTKFPRYKFTEYVRSGVQKVRRVRDYKTADAMVIDLKICKSLIKEKLSQSKNYDFIGMYQSTERELYTVTEKDPDTYHTVVKASFIPKSFSSIESIMSLIDIYNNFPNIKLLDIVNLNSCISTGAILDSSGASELEKLFKSNDNESIKLGMEMLTNYNVEDSLLYVMILASTYGRKMRNIPYWHSTSWIGYLNILSKHDITEYYFQHIKTIFDVIQEFLKVKNKKLMSSDIVFIKESIVNELKENYNFESSGFDINLTKEDILLNVKEIDIIQKSEESTDEIDKIVNEQQIEF